MTDPIRGSSRSPMPAVPLRGRAAPRGVTLLELLIALFLIGLLVAGAVPYVQELVEDSRKGKARADLDQIRQAVTKHNFQAETSIDRLEEIEGRTLGNVRDLRDPWGNPYRIATSELLVYSCGPNRRDERGRGDDLWKRYRVPPYVVRLNLRNNDAAPQRTGAPVPVAPEDAPPSPLDGTPAGDAGALRGN